jgi:UDP-N-acetylglucosamine--N-acetylmuramyl-(pentapeptide) pyrophosphoryl-undecaprenol N-acetylglucosamine transferase
MKFIIATGGSGGHLYPALMVAAELKKQGHAIKFMGSFGQSREYMSKIGFPYEELGARGIVGSPRKESIGSLMAMSRAIGRAYRSLKAFRPDAVLGFGGYGAFPVVLSAVLLKYPTMIHEQNVIPGRANALLAKWVSRIAISFKQSLGYFNPGKTIVTGCPCHLPHGKINRVTALRTFHLQENKTTLLVFGGSQGSRRINTVFLETVRDLKNEMDVQVIHISGKESAQDIQEQYDKLGIPFALFEFLDKMEEAYLAADLVVARSGAVTVSEIAGFRLPAIFIPYPHADGHQKANAAVLCDRKLARLIEDQELTKAALSEAIKEMVHDRERSTAQNNGFDEFCFPDAAQRLAKEAVQLIYRPTH